MRSRIDVTTTTIQNVLTRTTGYLRTVTSHSLQPYRGCTFGSSLCGSGCYVRHQLHLLKGREWGSFLEVRTNAADSYRSHCEREARYARRRGMPFSIFCSSATDPFVPQEGRYQVTRTVLEAMCDQPPDLLVLQTHSPLVADYAPLLSRLAERCEVRVHVSIESDRDRLPGLPPPAASVARRLVACEGLRDLGHNVVVTVAPLLPIDDPREFFERIARAAGAVVIDHFIGGDGSENGVRTLRTALPDAMQAILPESTSLAYRDRIVEVAREVMPGRVGVSIDGFAGKYA